jgi:hypothetical protein
MTVAKRRLHVLETKLGTPGNMCRCLQSGCRIIYTTDNGEEPDSWPGGTTDSVINCPICGRERPVVRIHITNHWRDWEAYQESVQREQ